MTDISPRLKRRCWIRFGADWSRTGIVTELRRHGFALDEATTKADALFAEFKETMCTGDGIPECVPSKCTKCIFSRACLNRHSCCQAFLLADTPIKDRAWRLTSSQRSWRNRRIVLEVGVYEAGFLSWQGESPHRVSWEEFLEHLETIRYDTQLVRIPVGSGGLIKYGIRPRKGESFLTYQARIFELTRIATQRLQEKSSVGGLSLEDSLKLIFRTLGHGQLLQETYKGDVLLMTREYFPERDPSDVIKEFLMPVVASDSTSPQKIRETVWAVLKEEKASHDIQANQ